MEYCHKHLLLQIGSSSFSLLRSSLLIDVPRALLLLVIVIVAVIVAVMMSMTPVPAMPQNVHQRTHQEQYIGQKLQRMIAMLDDYDISQQRNQPP